MYTRLRSYDEQSEPGLLQVIGRVKVSTFTVAFLLLRALLRHF